MSTLYLFSNLNLVFSLLCVVVVVVVLFYCIIIICWCCFVGFFQA